MKILYSIGCSINSWGRLLVSSLQLDFVPQITAPSAQQLSQHSIYFTGDLSSLYLLGLSMRILWEAVLEFL